ncbi:MAG: ankyrin repeat domain-containing protein [Acidobacteria bacterium]|nr:ankyrin repeat domain-containing protein [Acidobacteriota bacterium]
MKILLPITWTLWTASMAWLVYITYVMATERTQTADSLRTFGVVVMICVILAVGAIGPALWWAGRRESSSGVIAILILLSLPGIAFIYSKTLSFANGQKRQYDLTKEGDFSDPKARQIAAAIVAEDLPGLKALLAARPDLNQRDRVDNSLLDFAIRRFRFRKGNQDCIHLLLAAGANPNALGANAGPPPLLDIGEFPEIVRSLVEAGANIETLHDGNPPVVRFTMLRQWDSAIYLVQKGARLDTRTPEGLSIDYYLDQWKDGVEGVADEGWDRLRAAIAQRRK